MSVDELHSLLQRQIRKHWPLAEVPPELWGLLRAVDDAYRAQDSERKMIERSLELSSQELLRANHEARAILQALPDLVLQLDRGGRIISCRAGNPSDLTSPSHQLVGKRIDRSPSPEVSAAFHGALQDVATTRQMASFRYEMPIGGKVLHYEARLVPVNEEMLVAIVRNVTEQIEAEAALVSSKELLQAILDSTAESVWVVDRAGVTSFVNKSAALLCGWPIEELIGRSPHEILHAGEDAAAEAACPLAHALHRGAFRATRDAQFRRRDGSLFPVQFTASPIQQGGHGAGLVLTFTDVTEARTMESQLLQAQKLQAIGQLAAGIAHEINTPTQYLGDNVRFLDDSFTALRGILTTYGDAKEQLKSDPRWAALVAAIETAEQAADLNYLCEEIPAAVKQSLEGLDRVATIVRAMREFSHPGSKEIAPCDINHAIENTVTISRNEWKYVATLDLDLDRSIPPVPCYLNEFNQVTLNMIVNSAHAIGEAKRLAPTHEGRIRISSRLLGNDVAIEIEDNGAGIPPAVIGRIYEPFFTTKGVGKGTGQGLAIAHSVIVNKHRGRIEVESRVGEGTRFTIRIPRERSDLLLEPDEPEQADQEGAGDGSESGSRDSRAA